MDRENLAEQHKFLIDNALLPRNIPIDNLIVQSRNEETKWVEELTHKIGDWRGIFRSAYMKWAVTLNGLYSTSSKYENLNDENFRFRIHSLREGSQGLVQTPIAEWDSRTAAETHLKTVPLICTYGFIDLYNCLEEFVFDFYRIYLKHNPGPILKGREYSKLRRLRNNANESSEAENEWQKAFTERLDKWQRKRLYDNLGKVFLSFCDQTGIRKPSRYESSPMDWSESITGISIVRNTIVHGGKTVSKELAEFCEKPHSLGLNFKEGGELKIDIYKLQSVELFLNQLLTAINISLVEIDIKK